MAHDIADTCRACRQRQRQAPKNMPTPRLSVTFNEYGQVDLPCVGAHSGAFDRRVPEVFRRWSHGKQGTPGRVE
eukprot:5151045-Pyramimonas_sp.AAC.1